MKAEQITETRVLALIETYGADPMRWPQSERHAAQALIARTMTDQNAPRIPAALAEAEALDAMLSRMTVPVLSPETVASLQRAARPGLIPRLRGLLDWQGPIWQPTGALAAALVMGVTLGITNPDISADLTDLTDTTTEQIYDDQASTFDIILIGEESL